MLGGGNSGAWHLRGRTSVVPGGHSPPASIPIRSGPRSRCAKGPALRVAAVTTMGAKLEARTGSPGLNRVTASSYPVMSHDSAERPLETESWSVRWALPPWRLALPVAHTPYQAPNANADAERFVRSESIVEVGMFFSTPLAGIRMEPADINCLHASRRCR